MYKNTEIMKRGCEYFIIHDEGEEGPYQTYDDAAQDANIEED